MPVSTTSSNYEHGPARIRGKITHMPEAELAELIRAVEKCSRRIRKTIDSVQVMPRRIPRSDAVLLALLNRASNTLDSVVALSKKEKGTDAMAMSRVVVEIWIVVRWMTNRDLFSRANTFWRYSSRMAKETVKRIKENDPNAVIPAALESLEIMRAAETYSETMPRVKVMAKEVEELDATLTQMPYYYEVPYFMSSWYVHPNIMGVLEVVPDWGTPFRLKLDRTPRLCQMALAMGINCLLLISMRVGQALKLEITEQIQQPWNKWIVPLIATDTQKANRS